MAKELPEEICIHADVDKKILTQKDTRTSNSEAIRLRNTYIISLLTELYVTVKGQLDFFILFSQQKHLQKLCQDHFLPSPVSRMHSEQHLSKTWYLQTSESI